MPVVTMVLVKIVGEMLDGDYLKHLLVHHHLGNIQGLPSNLYEYFLSLQPSAPTLILFPNHVILLIGNLPGDVVLHLVQLLVHHHLSKI